MPLSPEELLSLAASCAIPETSSSGSGEAVEELPKPAAKEPTRKPPPRPQPASRGGTPAKQRSGAQAVPSSSALCPAPPPVDTRPAPRPVVSRPGSCTDQLLRMAFEGRTRRLGTPEQQRMVARLHEGGELRRKQREERLLMQYRPNSRGRRVKDADVIERMYYSRQQDLRDAVAQRTATWLPDAERVQLTRRAQNDFVSRLNKDLQDRKQRGAQRLADLAPLAPAGKAAFPQRTPGWLEQHSKELYDGVPRSQRSTA
eukprot:TRINITY_DN26937_c0_g1_i1.p1 TRINITY_DN26937_c0_g1~~TRINITY_DN26937_c0_g1_i1.p1  ORF type:complete len:258 (+),score=47.74 TRINITY_DN26937_c0_g1_i1:66-839(+)